MRKVAILIMLLGSIHCRHAHRTPLPALRTPEVIICPPPPPPPPGNRSDGASAAVKPVATPNRPNEADAPDDSTLRDINRILEDAFFDFDRYHLRSDAIESLQKNAAQLRTILESRPDLMLIVEGHCDELGSAEYNLALGDRRAEVAREFLVQLGIPANRLRTVTWGKERPICTEATEACRQKNRRAHVIYSE